MSRDSLRLELNSCLRDIAARTEPAQRCIILSGGVDTCAVLAAAKEVGCTFAAAFTVLTGETSPDRGFSIAAAAEAGLEHHIVEMTSEDLVGTYLPACVKVLATFDGMHLRNSLVVAAAMQKASGLGFKHAVVGDGADELFGGYSFMWGNADDPAQWREKRDKMCSQWTFATSALAGMYGMDAHSPFTEPRFLAWAISNTGRADCIGLRPIRLVYGGEAVEHETGKVILREAYDTLASWRRKDPIEVGSGATVIGKDPFWADVISDDELATATAALAVRGYVFRNKSSDKEQLVNFRAFEAEFGPDGHANPKKKRLAIGHGCNDCCFEIGDATFCSMCGAYPAQRATVP